MGPHDAHEAPALRDRHRHRHEQRGAEAQDRERLLEPVPAHAQHDAQLLAPTDECEIQHEGSHDRDPGLRVERAHARHEWEQRDDDESERGEERLRAQQRRRIETPRDEVAHRDRLQSEIRDFGGDDGRRRRESEEAHLVDPQSARDQYGNRGPENATADVGSELDRAAAAGVVGLVDAVGQGTRQVVAPTPEPQRRLPLLNFTQTSPSAAQSASSLHESHSLPQLARGRKDASAITSTRARRATTRLCM
jgi:hypothetical protein